MNRILIMLLATSAIFAGCESEKEMKTTPSGYKYEVIRESDTPMPEQDQVLLVNLKYVDQNDSTWINTAEMGMPQVIIKNDSIWKSRKRAIEEVMLEATKGDSLRIRLSANALFQGTPMPPQVTKEDTFNIYIGVMDVMGQDELSTWREEYLAKRDAAQMEKDKETIKEYLEENNIDAQTTESGLSYVITKEGTGQSANSGDSVKVNYVGYVLDGEYFDTSIEEIAKEKGLYNEMRPYGPFTFVLGAGQVIKGWDEGIGLLKEGGEATLYIPSPLAYGPRQRSEVIKANSILVFEVELVEVVKNESI